MFTKNDLRKRAKRFLDFRSIAVVGASNNPDRIGGKPLSLLKRLNFDGEVFGVNPKYKMVQGYDCFGAIADLPSGVEMAIVAVQAPLAVDALEELGKKGVQAVTVFTSGFAEVGPQGCGLQRRMREIAYRYGIAINGPNCVGTISFVNRRPATFASSISVYAPGRIGRVALVSQSGGFAPSIWADAMLAGTGFSHMFTTGNEAVLGFGDYLHLLAEDPSTDVVLGYMEGLEDGQEFCSAAEALRRAGKPLVMIKPGRSTDVARVVASHTGQMAGSYEAFQAAFKKHGVIEVDTLDNLTDHARVLSVKGASDPLVIATTSGGVGVYLTDLCEARGVRLAALAEGTEQKLRRLIPEFGTTKNPVDVTAQVVNNSESLKQTLIAISDDENASSVLFVLNGKAEQDKAKELIEIVSSLQNTLKKPLFTAWLGVSNEIRESASAAGINVFNDPARLLSPLGNMARWNVAAKLRRPTLGRRAGDEQGVVSQAMFSYCDGQLLLDEWKGMELLEHYGIQVPRRWSVTSGADLDGRISDIKFPCVVKTLHPVLAHKSRSGGVILNVGSVEELQAAWGTLAERGATTVIVEEQVSSLGPELVVGVSSDPTFGQRVVVGAGGVNTNEEGDFITILPPFNEEYLETSLRALRIWPDLDKLLEMSPYCLQWIYKTVEALCRLQSVEHEYVVEIECNPLLVHATGLMAVDVLAIGSNPTRSH
jgi:acetate---CoA ligase (ADP-forming)